MKKDKSVKIGLKSLVLMIFSAIFGFSNSLTAYYQMGYASIVWYIITAILFFLPSALIFAEYGAAFKGVKGGIFSWLKGSVSEKTAFIGTFIWLAAWVVCWCRRLNFSWFQYRLQFQVMIQRKVGVF